MITTFTQDDLIRYAYRETTDEESREIEQSMLCDAELANEYKGLVGVIKKLDEVLLTPPDRVLKNVLNYSKSLNLLSNE